MHWWKSLNVHIICLSRIRDFQTAETVQDHGGRSAGLQHPGSGADPQTTVNKFCTYITLPTVCVFLLIWWAVCVLWRQEIDKLLKEQEELHRNFGVCKSSSRQQQDNEDTQSLCALLEQKDMVEEEQRKEMQYQKELEKEVNLVFFNLYVTNPSFFSCLLILLVTQTTVYVASVLWADLKHGVEAGRAEKRGGQY